MNEQHIISMAQEKKYTKEVLYILLDGACEHNAIRHLFVHEGITAYKFLYIGTRFASVMDHGPVLAQATSPSSFLSWFWNEGPKIHAGIVMFSMLPIDVLACQLREVLMIDLPHGKQALFRFYDPHMAPAALALMHANGSMALRDNISAIYAPKFVYDEKPVWDLIMPKEQAHG